MLDYGVKFPYHEGQRKGEYYMQRDFLVESRSYDRLPRGSWQACRVAENVLIHGDDVNPTQRDFVALWLPAGTPMRWATGTRSIRNHCLQIFWPQRWYMLSAFYRGETLLHTYAMIIQPPAIQFNRLSYVDLDLSVLVKPDMSYEILTQAEFDHAAELLHYDEETRISALMSLRTLTSSIQRSIGIFSLVPHHLNQADFNLVSCGDPS